MRSKQLSDLKQAIMDRIECKFPSKIRPLAFLTETKQQSNQMLSEYFAVVYREAEESGLHTENWTTKDLEVIILLAGMKNPNQQAKILHDYADKSKLTIEDIRKFANVKETIEKQALKQRPASVSAISKGRGKPPAGKKPPTTAKEPEKKCT